MKTTLQTLCISDTHGFHEGIVIPEGTEMIICAGDAGNSRNPAMCAAELLDFFRWFMQQPAIYKIYVPGNHDTAMEAGMFRDFDFGDIIVLNHSCIEIEGIKIFGSPYTPSFGTDWSYTKDRAKMYKVWDSLPEDIDVLITHGPPKYVLDLTESRDHELEQVGCSNLMKAVRRIQPLFHIFGHVHDCGVCANHGTRNLSDFCTTFVNASVVQDGKFDKGLVHQGITINIKSKL